MAFWVNLKTAYVTFRNEYVESLWWILKQFWEKNLLFRAQGIVPYCRAAARRSAAMSFRSATEGAVRPASTSSSV